MRARGIVTWGFIGVIIASFVVGMIFVAVPLVFAYHDRDQDAILTYSNTFTQILLNVSDIAPRLVNNTIVIPVEIPSPEYTAAFAGQMANLSFVETIFSATINWTEPSAFGLASYSADYLFIGTDINDAMSKAQAGVGPRSLLGQHLQPIYHWNATYFSGTMILGRVIDTPGWSYYATNGTAVVATFSRTSLFFDQDVTMNWTLQEFWEYTPLLSSDNSVAKNGLAAIAGLWQRGLYLVIADVILAVGFSFAWFAADQYDIDKDREDREKEYLKRRICALEKGSEKASSPTSESAVEVEIEVGKCGECSKYEDKTRSCGKTHQGRLPEQPGCGDFTKEASS